VSVVKVTFPIVQTMTAALKVGWATDLQTALINRGDVICHATNKKLNALSQLQLRQFAGMAFATVMKLGKHALKMVVSSLEHVRKATSLIVLEMVTAHQKDGLVMVCVMEKINTGM
jgi:hypothetical protein